MKTIHRAMGHARLFTHSSVHEASGCLAKIEEEIKWPAFDRRVNYGGEIATILIEGGRSSSTRKHCPWTTTTTIPRLGGIAKRVTRETTRVLQACSDRKCAQIEGTGNSIQNQSIRGLKWMGIRDRSIDSERRVMARTVRESPLPQ